MSNVIVYTVPLEEKNNELCHHGIKGQKWGVRRFQNKDGSLTAAGKKRYYYHSISDKSFRQMEEKVRNGMSNRYSLFKKKPINISDVRSRGNLNESEARKASSIANKAFSTAKKKEPEITKNVVNAASRNGCSMFGLEYRMKQPTSLAAKIGAKAKSKDISFEQAAREIKDVVRYTVISDTDTFVKHYSAITQSLKSNGYSQTDVKNYFEKYRLGESMHKSIQSTFKSRDGYLFEIQFQTVASQAAKELKIPLYEERRHIGTTKARAAELEDQMRILADKVKDPPGILKIK